MDWLRRNAAALPLAAPTYFTAWSLAAASLKLGGVLPFDPSPVVLMALAVGTSMVYVSPRGVPAPHPGDVVRGPLLWVADALTHWLPAALLWRAGFMLRAPVSAPDMACNVALVIGYVMIMGPGGVRRRYGLSERDGRALAFLASVVLAASLVRVEGV